MLNTARKLDESATSIHLYFAEGIGRNADLDHIRFIRPAYHSAIRLSILRDVEAARGLWGMDKIPVERGCVSAWGK